MPGPDFLPPLPDGVQPPGGSPTAAPPEQGAAPAGAPGPPQVAPAGPAAPTPGQPASPGSTQKINISADVPPEEVESQKNRMVTMGLEMLHAPQTRDKIIDAMMQPHPVDGVKNGVVSLMQRTDEAMRKEGVQISGQAKVDSAVELVGEVSELSNAIGAKLDDKEIRLALSLALQDYVKPEIEAGRIDPQEAKAGIAQAMQNMSPEQRKTVNDQSLEINASAEAMRSGVIPAPAPPAAPGPAEGEI